jgi:hypothetical protein
MNKKRPLGIQFRAQFKVDPEHPTTLDEDFSRLFHLGQHLRELSPKLGDWYLGGKTKEESLLYPAFDDVGPTTAALAVLKERAKKEKNVVPMHSIGVWNGEVGADGASMGLFVTQGKQPSSLRLETDVPDFLVYTNVLRTTQKIVEIWKPHYASVGSSFYDPVFRDKPGIGWMLYLPRVISIQQVPEARELVPVMGEDEKGQQRQTGTIIVSVSDAPFSCDNVEHVKVANSIEIRLADQDLLPRFTDL